MKAFYVYRTGYGRVTIAMTKADCILYIRAAVSNGGSGYKICSEFVY